MLTKRWVQSFILAETERPKTTYVDYSAPRSELVFYRVNYVDGNGQEIPSASVLGISTSTAVARARPEAASAYDTNNIISDPQLTNSGTISAEQIQSFLSSQGSVLNLLWDAAVQALFQQPRRLWMDSRTAPRG